MSIVHGNLCNCTRMKKLSYSINYHCYFGWQIKGLDQNLAQGHYFSGMALRHAGGAGSEFADAKLMLSDSPLNLASYQAEVVRIGWPAGRAQASPTLTTGARG